jgi:hypothetical protein
MQRDQDRDYHVRRARAELDWAYRADRREAVEAHLHLSSLHMARVKTLTAPGQPVPSILNS